MTARIMASNLISLAEEVEQITESINNPLEFSDFPQTLVTEKIIFCFDIKILANEDNSLIHEIHFLLRSYFNLKKKISVKPPEFEFLLLVSNDIIKHSYINSVKDLQAAVKSVENYDCEEEKEALEMDKVFAKVAEIVEIPDPKYYKKCLPPTWVYHMVWLFGRNVCIPTMENTNPFDFLMMTPYFALDILYMYDKTIENNQCEQISHALSGLNENHKGYFLSVNISMKQKMFSCFAQLLGHPLIRSSQLNAKFNIMDLGPQPDIAKEDNNSD